MGTKKPYGYAIIRMKKRCPFR